MICLEQVSKRYKLYAHPADRLKEVLFRRPRHKVHTALKDLSFHVPPGHSLGVIGRNGAGKSTLLKLLLGVALPDTGTVSLEGRITGLLELGTGFDPNLTGEENILSNGLLLGMTRAEVETKRADIIAFSELGAFIQEPLRTYSSGMVMRLAFSIAIHAEPQAFLVDEALAVGDAHFQQKCIARIRSFRANGGTIVFVSHDLNAVKMLCDRVLVLERGEVLADGLPEEAVNAYNALLAGQEGAGKTSRFSESLSYGTGEVAIVEAELKGKATGGEAVSSGELVAVQVALQAHQEVCDVMLGMMIRDRFGQDIFGTNTYFLGRSLSLRAGEEQWYRFQLAMDLAPGDYTITLALHEGIDHTRYCYHWWDNAIRFQVSGVHGAPFGGVCNLHPQFGLLEEFETAASMAAPPLAEPTSGPKEPVPK